MIRCVHAGCTGALTGDTHTVKLGGQRHADATTAIALDDREHRQVDLNTLRLELINPLKRAREALDEMGRLDRVARVEGQKIWFDHRDPANPCSRRKPWRYDWPVTAETASRRSTASNGYPGMNVWLTIDPNKLAESEETWRTAKAELTQWYDALEAKKAAKIAAVVDSGGAGS